MVDSGWLALLAKPRLWRCVAVGTACRRHSVNHDVYFLSGKGVFKIQNIVEYSNKAKGSLSILSVAASWCKVAPRYFLISGCARSKLPIGKLKSGRAAVPN